MAPSSCWLCCRLWSALPPPRAELDFERTLERGRGLAWEGRGLLKPGLPLHGPMRVGVQETSVVSKIPAPGSVLGAGVTEPGCTQTSTQEAEACWCPCDERGTPCVSSCLLPLLLFLPPCFLPPPPPFSLLVSLHKSSSFFNLTFNHVSLKFVNLIPSISFFLFI